MTKSLFRGGGKVEIEISYSITPSFYRGLERIFIPEFPLGKETDLVICFSTRGKPTCLHARR